MAPWSSSTGSARELPAAEEKRMFGGTGFMVDGALACSVSARGLLVRVGP